MTRIPLRSDSATFSAVSRHTEQRMKRVSPSPLTGVTVVGSGGGGHREIGDRGAGLRPTQFGVSGQVTDDSDDGISGHVGSSGLEGVVSAQ